MPGPHVTFRLSRLSLIQKIAAGYAAMAVFTMASLFFSYLNLHAINTTTREIAAVELPVISALIKLRSSLLAQEGYARKYAILGDAAFLELFRQREKESLANLAVVENVVSHREIDPLRRLYASYQTATQRVLKTGKADPQLGALTGKMLGAIDQLAGQRQTRLQALLERANLQQQSAMRWTVIISLTGLLLAVPIAGLVTYGTFRSVRQLQRATHRIAAGDFDFDPQIKGEDEVAELAADFTRMAARLKVLEQMNLDASPLTRLPGNIAIERVLEERLQSGQTFAFCYADLDNFKPFSDHYGYAKGSELLRVTGDLIEATVTAMCGREGFVGHVGGDDFVMVVPAEQAAAICEEVIRRFDAEAITHFAEEHRKAGGIEGIDRYGVQRFFPITTISIAVIICGGGRYGSAVEIARAAAQIKDSAKEAPGSNYLISGGTDAT